SPASPAARAASRASAMASESSTNGTLPAGTSSGPGEPFVQIRTALGPPGLAGRGSAPQAEVPRRKLVAALTVLLGRGQEGQTLVAAHEVAGSENSGRGVHGEGGTAGQQLLQGHPGLQPGGGRAQAVVGTVGEGQDGLGVTGDV